MTPGTRFIRHFFVCRTCQELGKHVELRPATDVRPPMAPPKCGCCNDDLVMECDARGHQMKHVYGDDLTGEMRVALIVTVALLVTGTLVGHWTELGGGAGLLLGFCVLAAFSAARRAMTRTEESALRARLLRGDAPPAEGP